MKVEPRKSVLLIFAAWCGVLVLVATLSPAGRGNVVAGPVGAAVALLLAPSFPFISPSATGFPLLFLLLIADESGTLARLAQWVIAALVWSALIRTAAQSSRRKARIAFFLILGILSMLLVIALATSAPVHT
jgi:hypothetical protein